jgi:hypothetical protein
MLVVRSKSLRQKYKDKREKTKVKKVACCLLLVADSEQKATSNKQQATRFSSIHLINN